MIINAETFADLDTEDREALQKEAIAFETQRWTRAESDQAAYEQKLADNGATIVRLNDAELAQAAQKVRSDVWPQILKDVGAEWGQGILDKVAN